MSNLYNFQQRPNMGPAGPDPKMDSKIADPALYREGPAAKPLLSGFAVAGLICSIVGIGLFGLQVIGIGLSIRALYRIRDSGERGKGLAIAGIIVGVVTAVLAVVELQLLGALHS
jgi:hypothetical protein